MKHDNLYSVTMYRILLAFFPESMSQAFRLQEPEFHSFIFDFGSVAQVVTGNYS